MREFVLSNVRLLYILGNYLKAFLGKDLYLLLMLMSYCFMHLFESFSRMKFVLFDALILVMPGYVIAHLLLRDRRKYLRTDTL